MEKTYLYRSFLSMLLLIATVFFCINTSVAQPVLPQRVVTVQPTQSIDFGIFYVVSAGTITVDWQGAISTTGGVVSLSAATARPAIFDITLCEGRSITITYDPTTTMTNGGQSLTLNVGDTEKGPSGSSFPVTGDCSFVTTLRVGGTLDVPVGALAGVYNGDFSITFTQE